MFADRIINTHTSKAEIGTLPNGDTFWVFGPYRERYSPTDKALYFEIKSRGVWYISEVDRDVDIDMTGHDVSPVQEIN